MCHVFIFFNSVVCLLKVNVMLDSIPNGVRL